MFNENDIMTSSDFNVIEGRIYQLNQRIRELGYTITPYELITISDRGNLLDSYLNNIEQGIFNLGKYYYKPLGWQKTKEWQPLMSFSYKDVNRWIKNLNLIQEALNNESSMLLPSDTLYPSDTLLPR